jgi:hypothetical protein
MEALGPVLLLVSIPLMFRWVPRNRLYGFRTAATLRDEAIWYEVNAWFARYAFVLGAVMIALEFVLPLSLRTPVLWMLGAAGILTIIIAAARKANRLDRRRDKPYLR